MEDGGSPPMVAEARSPPIFFAPFRAVCVIAVLLLNIR